MKIKTANKGEWSELYALLRILADGKIRETDASLKKLDQFMQVLECFGPRRGKECTEYTIHPNANEVEIRCDGKPLKALPMEILNQYANDIYKGILSGKNVFGIDGSERIMEAIGCVKIKSPSYDKADIRIRAGKNKKALGYSIKSYLGRPPTLVNASHATNFRYKVIGIDKGEAERINAIAGKSKIRNRIKAIEKRGGELIFDEALNPQFAENLRAIDPEMEKIIAYMMFAYFSGKAKSCDDIADKLENENPLHFPYPGNYRDKIIKFLSVMEIGMIPSKPWNGEEKAKGGCIVVKKDGEVLVFNAYRTYEQNGFERYLLENARLDTPSSSRWGFGTLHFDKEGAYINLNLQIRLKG